MSMVEELLSKKSRHAGWSLVTTGTVERRWLAKHYWTCCMLFAVSLVLGGCRATRQADQVSFDHSGSVLRDPLPVEYSPGPRGVDPQHAGYCRPQWRVLASRSAGCCSEGCEECLGPGIILEADPILETGAEEQSSRGGEAVPRSLDMPSLETVPSPPSAGNPGPGLDTRMPRPVIPVRLVGARNRLDTSRLLGLPQVD